MKANEFVKKFGLEHSIEAVLMMPKTWDYCCLRIPDFEFQKHVSSIADCVDMNDLKRLVESHELIEKHNGLDNAKSLINHFKFIESENLIPDGLEQAVADVESCIENQNQNPQR